MKREKSRFTLIEMLAVVAIASILIALMTPAAQSLMFGSRVDQCASNLKLAMEQAQSKAVASRKYVALILPVSHGTTKKELIPYCKSGYRMAYVKKEGDDYKFVSWVPGSDWKNANNGAMLVSIEDSESNAKNAPSAPTDTDFSLLAKITSPPEDDLGNSCISGKEAIIFSPYGGVVNRDQPLYFTITECKYNDGSYSLDNPDNFLVLKLNAITGRVTYFDPYAD